MLLSAVILWLGYLNWNLYTEVADLTEKTDSQDQLIGLMAKELTDLGSPNVKLVPVESYNIQYDPNKKQN